MGDHTYEFGYGGNSYFNGRDAVITRDDGKSIRINSYERNMAVCVKDYSFGLRSSAPEDVKRMAAELPERPTDWGEMTSYDGWAYEHIARDQFWHDASWLTGGEGKDMSDPEAPAWARGVYSAGRSGGWCVIEGTDDLAENGFPTREWTEQDQARLTELDRIYEDDTTSADDWDTLRDEHDTLIELRDAVSKRDEFLRVAFDIVGCIEGAHESLEEHIREAHAELEEQREHALVRSEN